MNRNRLFPLLLALLLLLVAVAPAAAEPVAEEAMMYALVNQTIDGGGAIQSDGGRFTVGSTIGQHDATTHHSSERFGLAGGYWGPRARVETNATIFLPIVTR